LFGEKKNQRKAAQTFIWTTSLLFITLGIIGMYWGIQAANMHTVIAVDEDGNFKMMSVFFFLLLLCFGAYAIAVLRKPRSKGWVRSYAVMIFCWAFILFGVAIMAPKEGKKTNDYIMDACRNNTNPIHLADTVYTQSNLVICGASCPCYADRQLWIEKDKQ